MKTRRMTVTLTSIAALCLLGVGLFSCGNKTSSSSPAASTSTSTTVAEKILTVTAADTKVYVGASITLTVKCSGKNVSDTLAFASSDETKATVTSAGVVTGVAAGSVDITVSATGYTSGKITLTIAATTEDVTFTVTPAFASTSVVTAFEDGKALWIASAAFGTDTAWGYKVLTKNADSTWSITLKDCEFDQTLSYNIYYDDATTFGWRNVNTESVDNAARTYTFVEGTTAVALAATFDVPTTVAPVTVKISGFTFVDGTSLLKTTYVGMWDSINGSSVLLSRNDNSTTDDYTDDYFTYTLSNVGIGTSTLKITPYVALADNSSQLWNSSIENVFYPITAYTTEVDITGFTFAAQPVAPTGTLTATFNVTFTNLPSGHGDVQIVNGANWNVMTAVDADAGTYTYTTAASLAEGDVYSLYVYTWATNDYKMYADTSSTLFSFTMGSTNVTITLTGDFSTLIGAIVVA